MNPERGKLLLHRADNLRLLMEKMSTLICEYERDGKVPQKYIDELISYVIDGPFDRKGITELVDIFRDIANWRTDKVPFEVVITNKDEL